MRSPAPCAVSAPSRTSAFRVEMLVCVRLRESRTSAEIERDRTVRRPVALRTQTARRGCLRLVWLRSERRVITNTPAISLGPCRTDSSYSEQSAEVWVRLSRHQHTELRLRHDEPSVVQKLTNRHPDLLTVR